MDSALAVGTADCRCHRIRCSLSEVGTTSVKPEWVLLSHILIFHVTRLGY